MSRPRVLLWTELYWPYQGGAEIFLEHLVAALRDRGYEMAVLTSHDSRPLPDEDEHRGVRICRLPFRQVLRERSLDALVTLQHRVASFKRSFAADLVHVNGVTPSALFHLRTAGAHPGRCLVGQNRALLPVQETGQSTLLRQLLGAADWVVSVSQAALAQAHRLVPALAGRSSVIYAGWPTAPRRNPLPLPPDGSRIVFLGRLVGDKGVDLAVRAFAVLAGCFPRARLQLVGDGAERGALERLVRDLAISDRVDFTGWVQRDGVVAAIEGANIVVIPSRTEGLPSVAVEAALLARPIVATGVGGLPEVVQHGATGLLVPAGDVDALTAALTSLLERPETGAAMGARGRQRALALFDWERCVDRYDALYRRLVPGGRVNGAQRTT